MSPLELAALVFALAGVMGIIGQRGAARREGRPVKRWVIALCVAMVLVGIALEVIGVSTGVVSLA